MSNPIELPITQVMHAADILRNGGLVAFPTETVYGLGADASNPEAVARIYAVKGRPTGHPLIVHLGSIDELAEWAAAVPPVALALAEAFWPGPLTLILRRSDRVADAVTGGRDTVGLRVPDHAVAQELLAAFGGGIAAPSANRFGHVSPTTAAHVRADLGDDVDMVVDGGSCTIGVESTIIDLSGARPEVLRPGGVSTERLADVIGHSPIHWSGDGKSRAPGMLKAHYAPAARVEIVAAEDVVTRATHLAAGSDVVGVLAPTAIDCLGPDTLELEPVGDAEGYARQLYDRLRQADRLGVTVLLAVPPPEVGVGVAVLDRLRRAAAPS